MPETFETFGFGTEPLLQDSADDLAIPPEAESNFQYDEDERGGVFPPRITPGPVTFRYEVTETKNDTAKDKGTGATVPVHEVTWTGHVQVEKLAPSRLIQNNGEFELPVRFNRDSDYKSAKMKEAHIPSGIERLHKGLGLREEFGVPTSRAQLNQMVDGASGRLAIATLIWEAAKKLEDGNTQIFSTSPKKGRSDPWPRHPSGALVTEVTFRNGETKTAQERLVNVRPLPKPKESS